MLSEISKPGFRRLAIAVLALMIPVSVMASTTLRGRLDAPAEASPLRLVTVDGEVVELAADEGLEATMRDPQLAERDWEIRGEFTDDGRFAVTKIFTVKDGVLHRVTYYCLICHITTHEPGLCMCCQGDTDLRELPGE